jgi:hypothetical protein
MLHAPSISFLPHFITRPILGEEYRSLSSSFCSFLHSPLPRSSQAQIFSSTPYSQTPSAYVTPLMCATKSHAFWPHTKSKISYQLGSY